jgi:hypothetical protein
MADDKNRTGPQDASRINVNEKYELDYWSGKYGVTAEELRVAVQEVGVMAKDVEEHLKKRR